MKRTMRLHVSYMFKKIDTTNNKCTPVMSVCPWRGGQIHVNVFQGPQTFGDPGPAKENLNKYSTVNKTNKRSENN